MPWQQLIADVGGELDPDTGLPAYREIVWTVPRQSGKTTLVLSWECDRALNWGPRRQRCIYSAQTGADARKKLMDDQIPLLEASGLGVAIRKTVLARGEEGVVFKTGSRIDLMPSTDTAGHGRTVDLGVIDEAFADHDSRREQALLPAMVTRDDAQMLVTSTAGTDASLYLNAKVKAGRAAVERGDRSGLAYFEWSAGSTEVDIEDPAVWRACMPALGTTIGEGAIRHALATMLAGGEIDGMTGAAGFLRAFLNVATAGENLVFPAGVWAAVSDRDVSPVGRVVLGVDVGSDRSHASIVAADHDGRVEVVEFRAGTGWVAGRAAELQGRWAAPVVVHSTGPAKSLIPELEQAGVQVVKVSELAAACAAFYDRVVQRRVAVRRSADLDAAVAGAHRKVTGDTWVWARRVSNVDLSPLVAATLAVWLACQASPVYDVLDSVR